MFQPLFDISDLVPHGTCLAWRPELFWSLAMSDGALAIAYYSIALTILLYLIKRADMYLRWVAVAFVAFVVLCASTHVTDLMTLWVPQYGVQVLIKFLTAVVSVGTAAMMWPLLPRALAMPSTAQLAAANQALEREIEERRQVEADLRATGAELRAANTELDSFAYAVSHDLRAPLRAMTGFSEALREDYGTCLNAEAEGYLDEISSAGIHMGKLIDGLLQLSRATRGALRREEVDISDLAGTIVAELRHNDPDRRIVCDIAAGITAWGDPRMIELVIRNLLSNAWKYTATIADPRIRVSGGQNIVVVSDNGAGFDMIHADKLFKPFQRLHRQDEFPGIGISLSTVNRIIQRHGGTVQADGAVGRGATFHITLPGPGGG